MALGSELFSLATSFDPYGAMRKGEMAPQAYDVEQQKLGLEQQKMVLQKQQLEEQQKELKAEQGKPPELAQMSQNILGEGYKLTDENGLPTVAGQVNDLLVQSKQEIALGQKLVQQAKYMEPGSKEQISTLAEGRRMLNNGQKYQVDAKATAKKEQNNALYGLATASNQNDWNNVVKAWENNGLPIPKGFPTEYSPENMKKIAAMAPLEVQQKIETELRKREEDKRKQNKELRDEHRDIIRDRKDDLQMQRLEQLLSKGAGGEGGGPTVNYGTLQEKLDDPKYGVAQGKIPAKEQTIARRITTDAAEVTQGIDQVMTLTEGGMRNVTGTTFANVKDSGFLSATGKAFTNTISNKESQMYDAMMYPLVKGISLYANPDYRPTDNDVKIAMQSYKATSGQPHIIQLEKLAELKKNFNAASESFLDSNILNAQQATSIKKQIKEVNKAIPWDVNDVVKFTRQKDYKKFDDYLKKTPSKETPTETKPTETKPQDINQMAIQAFGSFDESKYQYRINPETGKIQRALK